MLGGPTRTQPVQQLPDTQRPGLAERLHAVRSASAAPSAHTGEPVAHDTVPLRQGLGLPLQAPPGVHVTQLPLTQAPPGHTVPSLTFPDSVHTPEPELQLIEPVLHGLAGEQLAPELHGLHAPFRQAPPGQAVPFMRLEPSVHTAEPELQSVTPFRQAELGFEPQLAPPLQGLHDPLRHTPPAQAVPLVLFEPFTQTAVPVPQSMVPF